MSGPHYFTGLDLGQTQDYTALVTLAQYPERDPERPDRTRYRYEARHVSRFPLLTPYPAIVDGLWQGFGRAPLHSSALVVDRTGVGVAVHDMIAEADLPAHVVGYTITAGTKCGAGTVPKVDLVGAVQAALGTRRLEFASRHPLAGTLAKELEDFRVKVTSDRNETFAAWREKDHDDLVLALAMAVWYAELHPGDAAAAYGVCGETDPFHRLPPGTFSRGVR